MRRIPKGWLAVVLAGAFAGGVIGGRLPQRASSQVPGAKSGVDGGTPLGGVRAPNFRLTDQIGRPVSLSDLRGRVVLLAFVASDGGGVDALTAATVRDARMLLGRAGRKVALVAINVDLRHRSVAAVARFTRAERLGGRWTFLTGQPRALRRVMHAYGIYSQEIDGVDQHTAAIYLIRPDGREADAYLVSSGPANVPDQAWVIARAAAAYVPGARVLPVRTVEGASGRPVYLSAPTAFRLPRDTAHGPEGTVTLHPGDRPTLVDFFATWCHDCQEELRSLAAVRWDPGMPRIVAVDLRIAEPSGAAVRLLIERTRPPFAVGLDTTGRVADRYAVSALPALALVSSRGRIVWRHVGYLSARQLADALRTRLSTGGSG